MNTNIGIYKILNTKNNKVYIGSSENLRKRKYNHFSALKTNTHHSIYLQRAYNKTINATSIFVFQILEYCNKEILLERENYYLNLYCKSQDYINKINKDFLKLSYNILPIAMKGFRKKHRPESIEKFRMNHPNRKEVLCYTSDGKIFGEYTSVGEAGRMTKISSSGIATLCKTKRYIGKPYIFGYKDDPDFINFIEKSKKPIIYVVHNKGKKMTLEQKINLGTKIKCTNLITSEILIFNSQKEACKYFNLQPCTINRCLKNKKPYRKRLSFEYYDIVQS